MDARSEVVLRQLQLFQKPVLFAGLPADNLLEQLPHSHGWCWLLDDYQYLHHRFADRVHFSTTPPDVSYQAVVLFLPKSKELTAYLVQSLASLLKVGDALYLVGEKRAGIEGAAKQLSNYGKPIKLDSARHCQLWQVCLDQQTDYIPLASLIQSYQLPTPYPPLLIKSLPGVFSHGRLDQGTALLLEHLTDLPEGNMLDFGCGAGVIGSALKTYYPQSNVYLQDIDAFALDSSQLTLNANQLEATVVAGNGIAQAPKALTAIISNPPFHQGINTSYHTTEQLLQQAKIHLTRRGELRLVANSFLKYPDIILKAFGNCSILAKANGFTIYSAYNS